MVECDRAAIRNARTRDFEDVAANDLSAHDDAPIVGHELQIHCRSGPELLHCFDERTRTRHVNDIGVVPWTHTRLHDAVVVHSMAANHSPTFGRRFEVHPLQRHNALQLRVRGLNLRMRVRPVSP
jgi:hypothetical protein